MVVTLLVALLLFPPEEELIESEETAAEYCQAFANVKLPEKARALSDELGPSEAAQAYANGEEVRRNLKVAAALMCQASEEMAPLEWWSMLDHLRRMQSGEEKKPLDYCDYVVSGRGTAHCASLQHDLIETSNQQRLERVRASLKREVWQLLEELFPIANRFVDAEALRLADDVKGGSLYTAYLIGEQGKAEVDVVDAIENYAKKRAPAATAEEVAAVNLAIDAEAGELGDLAIEAHKWWLPYREALVAFYLARWRGAAEPAVLRREVEADFTRQRLAALSPDTSGSPRDSARP